MRKPLAILAFATSLVGASAAVAQAQPLPAGGLVFGVDVASDRPALDPVQFFWAGRNYCWYDGGWNGPGWYWCGYPWRRGYGWGGPYGWRGWYGGVRYGWRDGHYDGHWDRHDREGGGHGDRHGGDHEHDHR